jgi:hypothetical protein
MDPLQIITLAADLALIAAVVYLLARLRRLDRMPQFKAPADVEDFLNEASRLTGEFDRLLAEKRELVNSTVEGLDRRIAELKALAAELEQPEPAPESRRPAAQAVNPAGGFRRQVIDLARQGQGAAQIAKATGRPRGEVELVLGLKGQGK